MISENSPYYKLISALQEITEDIEQIPWEESDQREKLKQQEELQQLFMDRVRDVFESFYSVAENNPDFPKEELREAIKPMTERILAQPIYGEIPHRKLFREGQEPPVHPWKRSHFISNCFFDGISELHYHALKKEYENKPCKCKLELLTGYEMEMRPPTDKKTLIKGKGGGISWLYNEFYQCDYCRLYWEYNYESAEQYHTSWKVMDKID